MTIHSDKAVYESYDELVAAEANGWVAVAILRELAINVKPAWKEVS